MRSNIRKLNLLYVGLFICLVGILLYNLYFLIKKRDNDSRFALYTNTSLKTCKSAILNNDSFFDHVHLSKNIKYEIEEIILDYSYDFGRDAWGNPIQFMITNNMVYLWSYGPNEIDDEMLKDDLVISFLSQGKFDK